VRKDHLIKHNRDPRYFDAVSRILRLVQGGPEVDEVQKDLKLQGAMQHLWPGSKEPLPWLMTFENRAAVQMFLGGLKMPTSAGLNAGRVFSTPKSRAGAPLMKARVVNLKMPLARWICLSP
jgi:hypothetical protein